MGHQGLSTLMSAYRVWQPRYIPSIWISRYLYKCDYFKMRCNFVLEDNVCLNGSCLSNITTYAINNFSFTFSRALSAFLDTVDSIRSALFGLGVNKQIYPNQAASLCPYLKTASFLWSFMHVQGSGKESAINNEYLKSESDSSPVSTTWFWEQSNIQLSIEYMHSSRRVFLSWVSSRRSYTRVQELCFSSTSRPYRHNGPECKYYNTA